MRTEEEKYQTAKDFDVFERKLAFYEPESNKKYEKLNEEKFGKNLDKKKGSHVTKFEEAQKAQNRDKKEELENIVYQETENPFKS